MEKWCMDKGYDGFKITNFNENEGSLSKNYPENCGAIYFGDYEKLEEVKRMDKI